MNDYDNLVDAISGLREKGFMYDFNLKPDSLVCASLNVEMHPEDFEIKEYYRFEGESDPRDNSVIYAIESKNGEKGILIDAYGVYAEAITSEMGQKLGSS